MGTIDPDRVDSIRVLKCLKGTNRAFLFHRTLLISPALQQLMKGLNAPELGELLKRIPCEVLTGDAYAKLEIREQTER